MITLRGQESTKRTSHRRAKQDVTVIRKRQAPRQYVSKHFGESKHSRGKVEERIQEQDLDTLHSSEGRANDERTISIRHNLEAHTSIPRIYFGLDVDELSSDSDLTDVPDDVGPDPFEVTLKTTKRRPPNGKNAKHKLQLAQRSKYFPDAPRHRNRDNFLAILPFPPLSLASFGLMQEKLAHQPFKLLIATIFLNKTPGMRAMPVFYQLMERYPTPNDLAQAEIADVTEMIRHLGFQNQRARKCIEMAKVWVQNPPTFGKRYRKLHYPRKTDGRDIKEGEIIDDTDQRVGWEISHLPGLGPYSHDSWRMFCRDELREKATTWLGDGALDSKYEPEWKRVLPTDKELRAYMTWMWLKEGWLWNKETGHKTKADQELLDMARDGGIVQEPQDQDHLVVTKLSSEHSSCQRVVETPAGEYIPEGL